MDQAGGEDAGPGQAAPLVEEVPELSHTEEVGATEVAPPAAKPEPAHQEKVFL